MTPEPLLEDGGAPATPDQLLQHLEQLGIQTTTVTHPPVYTVEEARATRGDLPGGHTKNLFLRNKKGRMWLVVCDADRTIDIKALGNLIGAGRFSFGSPDRLMRYLGVIAGAVTPFAAINDHGGAVTVVIEAALERVSPLNFHPLDNGMTTAITPSDLVRFLESVNHHPTFLPLD